MSTLHPPMMAGVRCRCGVYTVRPEVHHIHPRALGGPDAAANRVRICARCHNDIHELLDRLLVRPVAPDEIALVGRHARRLAAEGLQLVRDAA